MAGVPMVPFIYMLFCAALLWSRGTGSRVPGRGLFWSHSLSSVFCVTALFLFVSGLYVVLMGGSFIGRGAPCVPPQVLGSFSCFT